MNRLDQSDLLQMIFIFFWNGLATGHGWRCVISTWGSHACKYCMCACVLNKTSQKTPSIISSLQLHSLRLLREFETNSVRVKFCPLESSLGKPWLPLFSFFCLCVCVWVRVWDKCSPLGRICSPRSLGSSSFLRCAICRPAGNQLWFQGLAEWMDFNLMSAMLWCLEAAHILN